MKLRILLATTAIAGLLAVPSLATANSWRDCYCYDPCYGSSFGSNWHAYGSGYGHMGYGDDYMSHRTAVAGYTSLNRHPSLASLDQMRIAEYNSIFSGMAYGSPRVAGYSSTSFTPWMDGGTWVTVNGQRIWATPSDFTWSNNRWVWADSPNAMIVFDDPRYQVTTREWSTPAFTTRTPMGTATFSPWTSGGTWATVNGQRVWVTENDFAWRNNRWVWTDDDSAVINFDDDRFNINSRDWGVSVDSDRFDVDSDRFDLDPDLDIDRLEVDPDRFNIDSDRLKIETDID